MSDRLLGIDYGTTNSAMATFEGRDLRLASFTLHGEDTQVFRSVLYCSQDESEALGEPVLFAGPRAIEMYLEEGGTGRWIQSTKSFLASASFEGTRIFNRFYHVDDMIAALLRSMRRQVEMSWGDVGARAVVGRPVRFVSARTDEDEALAMDRLRSAFSMVGFSDVTFAYEPVAAASQYEANLDHDECILVADFGGGTTDLCVMRVGPNAQKLDDSERILGVDGVGLAGDAFDGRVVFSWLCPYLGLGTKYRSEFGNMYEMPTWPYYSMMRWHHVALLNDKKTLKQLYDIAARSLEAKKVRTLIDCVEQEMGFYIYQSVERGKIGLSGQEEALFSFRELEEPIEENLSRDQFESWIDAELQEISQCCDRILEKLNLTANDIDRVFMTGGSAFVPAVRQIFAQRFGEEKLGSGAELTSVVSGLAQIAKRIY
ncbi:MAG: Hsp70 family protein [Myxococcales bacterium]|nr:Hsp70 family protein [Myxococcales bacterium]